MSEAEGMTLEEALQAEFDGMDSPEFDPQAEADKSFVEKFLRMLARREAEQVAMKARIERLKSKIESVEKEKCGLIAWMHHRVEEAIHRITAGTKKKSLSTAWGTAGYRKRAKPSVDFRKEDLEWVLARCRERCPQAITEHEAKAPPPTINKEIMGQYLLATGEDWELATLIKPGDEFYARAAKEKPESV